MCPGSQGTPRNWRRWAVSCRAIQRRKSAGRNRWRRSVATMLGTTYQTVPSPWAFTGSAASPSAETAWSGPGMGRSYWPSTRWPT